MRGHGYTKAVMGMDYRNKGMTSAAKKTGFIQFKMLHGLVFMGRSL